MVDMVVADIYNIISPCFKNRNISIRLFTSVQFVFVYVSVCWQELRLLFLKYIVWIFSLAFVKSNNMFSWIQNGGSYTAALRVPFISLMKIFLSNIA